MISRITSAAVEASLPDALVKATRSYMEQARAKNTSTAYGRAWRAFTAWCEEHGRTALPAEPATIAAWLAALADGAGGRPLSRSTINQYLAAVTLAHRLEGHGFDRGHPIVRETWAGIARAKARTEVERQARPVLADELRELLTDLRPDQLVADARDAALLALGWAAALRRSELVGLDWEKLADGTGILRIDERGIEVTLARSKAEQTTAVTIAVPRTDMPAACQAVERWVAVACLAPGSPVFRPIDKAQRISADRLTGRSMSRIVKARVRAIAIARGRSEADADELVARISGHSLRAGYATAAAAADVPSYRLQQHTRHRSAEMVARYVREADKWTKNGLRGVGF